MADEKKVDEGGERIAKVIARAGLASRREAEDWIAAGRVAVNGTAILSPARNVTAQDRISIDGAPLPARERTRLFLYHKPRGLVTTHADPHQRATIFERLPKHLPRLISIGRLDFNTEGLLLLTNDGGLARVLELPATGWLRRYRVRAHGSVTQEQLDALRAGVTVEGIRYREIDASLERVQGSNLWLTFAIREGKNREVRHVLGHLGLTVTRLIRVSFGPFQLGELAEGEVEEVRTRVLREQLGERLVALSGADFSSAVATPPPPPPPPDSGKREHADTRPHAKDRKSSADNRRPTDRERAPKDSQRKFRSARRDAAAPAPLRSDKSERASARPHAKDRKSAAHAWRARDEQHKPKKLQRKFRGARRDEDTPRDKPAGKASAGLLTDRKGRRVLVERFAPKSPRPAPEPHRHGPRDRPRGGGRRSRPRDR